MKVDVLSVVDRLIGNTRTMAGLSGDPRMREHVAEGEQARAAIAEIFAERDRLRGLAASCYAGLVAECDLPEEWADVFLAAAQGDDFSVEGMLPFTRS